MTLVLTTATNPGTATWSDASLIGGSLFAQSVRPSPPDQVDSSVLSVPRVFATKLTVPAGAATGDLFNIALIIDFANPDLVNGAIVDLFVRLGGVTGAFDSFDTVTLAPGGSETVVMQGTMGLIAQAGATAQVAAEGLVYQLTGATFSLGNLQIGPFDTTTGFDVEVFVEFSAGSSLTATATLNLLQLQITHAVP